MFILLKFFSEDLASEAFKIRLMHVFVMLIAFAFLSILHNITIFLTYRNQAITNCACLKIYLMLRFSTGKVGLAYRLQILANARFRTNIVGELYRFSPSNMIIAG